LFENIGLWERGTTVMRWSGYVYLLSLRREVKDMAPVLVSELRREVKDTAPFLAFTMAGHT